MYHAWLWWLDPLHNEGYQFWSGIGSGSPIIAGFALLWRRHNCHVHGCWRIAWKAHGEHWLCRKHHPSDPPKAEEIT